MPEQLLCEMGQSKIIGETRIQGVLLWSNWTRGIELQTAVPNEYLLAIRIESAGLRPVQRTKMPQEAAGTITVSLGRRTVTFDEARDRMTRIVLPTPLSLEDWPNQLSIGWTRKRTR